MKELNVRMASLSADQRKFFNLSEMRTGKTLQIDNFKEAQRQLFYKENYDVGPSNGSREPRLTKAEKKKRKRDRTINR